MKFMLLSLALLLAACSKQSDGTSLNNSVTVKTADDITDYSGCTLSSTQAPNLYSNWKQEFRQQDGSTRLLVYSFTGMSMDLEMICSSQVTQYQRVTIPVSVDRDIIRFRSETKQSQIVDTSCLPSWNKRWARYKIVGQCLELTFENGEHLLLPQEYSRY